LARKELVDYVEKHLRRGRHVKHIKRNLVSAGHPIHEIEEAVRHVLLTKPHLKNVRLKIFVGAFLFLATAVLLIGLFAFEEKERVVEYKENTTYGQLTDEQILRLAMDTGDTSACKFLSSDITYYACIDRYWERNDCFYMSLIGVSNDDCFLDMAIKESNQTFCRRVLSAEKHDACMERFYLDAKNAKDPSLCKTDDCVDRFMRDL